MKSAKRVGLAALGVSFIAVGGPVVGVLTPGLPLGFVVAGVGAGLVVRNSERGRAVVERTWNRFPRVTNRVPARVRGLIFGTEPG